jgi:TolB protein
MLALALSAMAGAAQAQDSAQAPGVRLVLKYDPGNRPSLIIVPGVGLDSARAIIKRDLDFSDRFESIIVPESVPLEAGPARSAPALNYDLYRKFGAAYAVDLAPTTTAGRTVVRLHEVNGGRVVNSMEASLSATDEAASRMQAHRTSDEIVRWVTGTPGVAATRFAFVAGGRIHVVDSDNWGINAVTGAGATSLSPAWSPTGDRLAYTRLGDGRGPVMILRGGVGAPLQVPGTEQALNITPSFSPDGRLLAFANSGEQGTNLSVSNVADLCCAQRLTTGRFADNLSPTFSPDGRRIAYVSTRAGPPQIYVMGADGTDPELLVPFDFGVTGSSNAPDWSPDGTSIAFHREVSGSPQVFIMDVASKRVRQLTSSGRNEDPSWAPDGRHLAYISDRSGRRQVWIIDIDTGRVRQLITPGAARLPAWSRRLP